ncbi:MAG: fibronectin type III domain-containing protein, partial [Elusimicrobiota bacterium]|nr:fibronectin type III domain-containing protein [Elusimicrobiota bacterium]
MTVVSVSTGSVEVNWSAGDNPPGTNYQLEESPDNLSYSVIITTTELTYTHVGLQPNTIHFYRVASKAPDGYLSTYSGPVSTYTLANIPLNLMFTVITSSSITLTWDVNNNSASTVYELGCSTTVSNQFGTVYSGLGNSFSHEGLTVNTTYYYRVRAVNLAGVYTDYSAIISTITIPDQVQNLVVVNVTSNTIYWQWDSVTGAASYNIYSTTATLPIANTALTYWLQTALTPNTSYTVQIAAVGVYNQEGKKSVAVSTFTLAEVPLQVTLSEPTTWTLKVSINPGNNPPQTRYAIKFVNGSETKFVQTNYYLDVSDVYQTTTTWATIIVKGLSENVRYTVTAIAKNEQDIITDESPQVQMFTLLNPPKDTDITITPALNSITVSVSSPPNYALGQTGCEFECITGSGPAGGTSSGYLQGNYTYTIDTGLQENTKYGYRVRYYNGDMSTTTFTNELTKYTLVSPPSIFNIIGTSTGSLRLETNQFNNDQSDSSGYIFNPYPPGQQGADSSGWIKTNIYNDDDLLINTSYTYTVKFKNGNGVTTSTRTATGSTLADIPGKPEIISVYVSSIGFTFSTAQNPYWTEYSIKALLYGTTYYLQNNYTLGSSIVYQTSTTWGSNINIQGLTPNGEYQISVQGRNLDGIDSYGLSTTTRTYAELPGQPTLTDVTTGSIKVIIHPGSNSKETTYLIKCITEGTTKYVQQEGYLDASATTYLTYSDWGGTNGVVVYGLYAAGIYEFSIQARNGYGNPTEFSVSATTSTLGVVPGIYVVGATTNTVQISIDP